MFSKRVSKAEQGKFYRPIEDLDIPIYLDKKIRKFFNKKALEKKVGLEQVINAILLKEIELSSSKANA
ncbi:MAG: hypothetical protein MUF15_07915 [Acidobacteria bacterium]|nr:hypothetical protein [Acidobacteriota bacterium]